MTLELGIGTAYVEPLLNYLRLGKLYMDDTLHPEGVWQEALYFRLTSLIEPLQQRVEQRRSVRETWSRKDICFRLINASADSSLRCQGLDLTGIDLSKLDLRHSNFNMTTLTRANLERCHLDHALLQESNLFGANLQHASLRGANLGRANLVTAGIV